MKRTILTGLALVAFAATLQAQNTSTVSQNGNGQSNAITQTGSNNESIVRQLTGTGSPANTGNVATVTQNATSTLPTKNQAFIDQINGADYNQAIISQTVGSGNRATIEQKGGNGFRSGGTSLYVPGSPVPTAGNYATITETGAGNNQTSIQQNAGALGGSGANYANIRQIGNANLGTAIEQSNKSMGNQASIVQGGSAGGATGNTAVVLQNNDSQNNLARVAQEGANKNADVQQAFISSNNVIQVDQLGANGFATVYQTDNADHNQATVSQVSTSNGGSSATIYQTNVSAYNIASVEQQGTTDAALINQSEQSKNNTAAITQGATGNNNVGVITQTYAYDGAGSTMTTGSGSTATINQNLTTGSTIGNQAEVTQGFAGGISTVSGNPVISDDNVATVGQENDVNVAKLQQGGVGNTATVTQRGYSTLKGVNAGMVVNDVAGQLGNINTLTVNQTGTLLNPATANATQIGIGNNGTITQTSN
ncbi:hypothetical protein J2I47_23325 [Fibrella sp. HMF5335]|uniref:Curlin associated repeat-containing protein n=1 Tax=Fibrella rubiginis TaxID=2817060 RepID=A0A939GMG9_9BACT|nr:hypothetical protein [Fibrella rubiginis]MBO0939501.1 hypothetical protein [Fibrella rubiginis]